MSYDFLSDLLVVEVAQFGPDALGGFLADLGARVIKVEPPVGGDPLRRAGGWAVGDEQGVGYLHLRWNRGKESVALDITQPEGAADFRTLVARADIVIEGMRAGVFERLGIGYDALREINPKLVYCSVSGMGRDGPYARMASHGPSFDAYAGLSAPVGADISKHNQAQPAYVGMYAVSLHAAIGVLAAVHAARRTGKGALIEVAAADSAAHWLPEALDPLLNPEATFERPGFTDKSGRMRLWARMENYRTRDGKVIFLMTYTQKSWKTFLDVVSRPDLDAFYTRTPTGYDDNDVAGELAALFATRDRDDWLEIFRARDVAAMPVNTATDVIEDPHFRARANTYRVALPNGTPLTLTSTPIRVGGQMFAATLAPELGEHTDLIREEFGLSKD